MSSKNLLASPETSKYPSLAGYLFRKGFFNDWAQRHVKLENNVITVKNGMTSVTFKLSADTKCDDSSLRAHCFTLSNPSSSDKLVLAAENSTLKVSWTTAISDCISKLIQEESPVTNAVKIIPSTSDSSRKSTIEGKEGQPLSPSVSDSATGSKTNNKSTPTKAVVEVKPTVSIRVKHTRKLIVGANIEVFVRLTLNTTVLETKRVKGSESREFDELFTIPWSDSLRYAKAEVFSLPSPHASPELLGTVLLPVYGVKSNSRSSRWYALSKTSDDLDATGEVELEVVRQGALTAENKLTLQLFEAARQVDFKVADSDTGELSVLHFTNTAHENLEDASLQAVMVSIVSDNKISTPGLVFLTNHRLLFASIANIISGHNISSSSSSNKQLMELSTYLLIKDIASITMYQGENDEDTYYIESEAGDSTVFVFTAASAIDSKKPLDEKNMSAGEVCLLKILKEHGGLRAKEGVESPAQRIFDRLNLLTLNKAHLPSLTNCACEDYIAPVETAIEEAEVHEHRLSMIAEEQSVSSEDDSSAASGTDDGEGENDSAASATAISDPTSGSSNVDVDKALSAESSVVAAPEKLHIEVDDSAEDTQEDVKGDEHKEHKPHHSHHHTADDESSSGGSDSGEGSDSGSGDDASDSGPDKAETTTAAAANKVVPSTVVIPVTSTPAAPSNLTVSAPTTPPSTTPTTTPVRKSLLSSFFGGGGSNKEKSSSATGTPPLTPKVATPTTPSASSAAAPTTPLTPKAVQLQSFLEKKASRSSLSAASAADLLKATNSSASFNVELSSSEDSASGSEEESETDSVKGVANENDLFVSAPNTPSSTTIAESFSTSIVNKAAGSGKKVQLQVDTHHDSSSGGSDSGSEASESDSERESSKPTLKTPVKASSNANISSSAALSPQPTTPITPKEAQLRAFLERKSSKKNIVDSDDEDIRDEDKNSNKNIAADLSSSDSEASSGESSVASSVQSSPVPAPQALPASTPVTSSSSQQTPQIANQQLSSDLDTSSGGESSGGDSSADESGFESEVGTPFTTPSKTPNKSLVDSTVNDPTSPGIALAAPVSTPDTPLTPKQAQLQSFLERKSSKHNFTTATAATMGELSPEESSGSGSGSSEESEGSGGEDEETSEALEVEAETSTAVEVALLPPPVPPMPVPPTVATDSQQFVPPELPSSLLPSLSETLVSESDESVSAGDGVSTVVDDENDEGTEDAHSADLASTEIHSSEGVNDVMDSMQRKDELTIAAEEVELSTDLEVTAAADTAIDAPFEEKVVVPVVETPASVKAAPLPPRQLPPPLPKNLPPVPSMDPSLFSQDASVNDSSQHSVNGNSSVAESLAAQVRSPPPSYTKLFAEIPTVETALEIVEQAIENENEDESHTLSPLSPLSPLSSAESAESLFTTSSENAGDYADEPELLNSVVELIPPPLPTQQVPPLPSSLPPPVPVEVNSSANSTELLELRSEIEQLRREQSEYLETISAQRANMLENNAKHAAELEQLSLSLQETENSHKELLINLSNITAEKEVEALKLAQEATQRENKLVEIVTDLESEISLLSSKVLTLTTENNQLQHTINNTVVSNEMDGERSGAISDQLLEEKDTLIALHEYSLSQKQETIDIYTQQLIELSTQYQQLETNYNELLENNENNMNNDTDTPPDILSLKMENNRKISELKQAHKIEISEQNESFSAQLSTAKDRESELVGIIYVLEGKEAALKEREESLLQQVAQLEETQSESTERENELASFVRSMKESQKNMLARESELLLTVNRLQTIINATEERETAFQNTITALEGEVTRLKATEKELETFVRDLKESQATAQEKEIMAQERENKLVLIVQNLEEAQNLAKERENELVTIILQLETTIEQKDSQIAAAAVSNQQEDVTAALIAEHQKQLESLQAELDSHILLLKKRDQAVTDKNIEVLSLQSEVASLTEQITQLNETHNAERTLQQAAQAALQESLQSSRDEVTRIEQAHAERVAALTELNGTLSLELERLRDTAAAQSAANNETVSDVTAATVDSAAVDAITEQLAAQTAAQQQLQSQYDALLATHNALIVANAAAAATASANATATPSSPDAVSSPPAGANRRRSVSVTGVDSSTSDIKKYLTIIAQKDSEIASLNSKVNTLDSTVNELVSSKDSLQLQLNSAHSENMELQTAVRDIKRKSKSKEQVESALATMLIRKSIRKSLHIPIGTDLSAVPQTYHDNENIADNSYELQYYANGENKEQFTHSSPLLKQALTTNTMTSTSSSNNLYTSGNDSTASSVTGGGQHSNSNKEGKGKQKRAAVLDYTQIAPQVSPTVPVARNSMCYSPLSVSSSRCSSPESDGDMSCATYDSKHDNINNFTPLSLNNPKLHRNTIAGSTLNNNTHSNAGDKNTRAHSVMTTGNRNIRNSPSLLTSSNYDLHNLIGSTSASGAGGAGGTGSVSVSDTNSVNGSTTPSPLTHTSSFIMGGGRRRLSVETRKKNNSMLNLNLAYDRFSNPNTPLSNSVSAAFGRNSTDSPEYMTQQQQLQQYQAYIQNEVSLEDKISQLVSSLKSTLVAPAEEGTANDEKKEEETKEVQKEEAAPAVKTPDTTPSKRRKSLKLPELVDLDDLFAEPVAAAINAELTVGDVVDDAAALESAGKGDGADQSAANEDANAPNTPVRPRSRSRTSVVVNTDQNTVFQMTHNDSGDYSSGLSISTDGSPMALQQVTTGLSPIPIKSALKSSNTNNNVNNNSTVVGGDSQQQIAITTKQNNNNVTTNNNNSNNTAVVISAVPDKFLQADKFLLELTFKDYITRVYSILYKNIRDRVISIFLTIRETTLLSLGSNNSSSVSLINSSNNNNNVSSGNMRRNSTMFQSIDISDTNSINSYNTASGVTPKNRRSPSVQNMSPLASQQERKDAFAESYSVADLWRKLHSYSVLEQNTTSPSNNTNNIHNSTGGDSKKHLCSIEQLFQLLLLAGINSNKQNSNGANSPTNSNINNSNNSESKLYSAIQIQLSSILFPYSNSTPGITNSNSNDGAPQTPLTKLLNTIKSLQYYHTIMIGSGNVSVQDTSKLKLGAIDALCNDVGYVMNIFTNATIRSGDSSKLRNKPVTAKIYELKEQYEIHCHYKAQRAAAARSSHYEHKTVFEYHNNIATMQQNLIHGTHNINISGNSSTGGGNSIESSSAIVSVNNNSNNGNNNYNNTQSSYTNRIYNVSDNSNNSSNYISSTGHSEEMKNNSNSPFHNHPHHSPYTIDTTFNYNNYNNIHDNISYNMMTENKTPTLSELVISSEALYAHLLVAVSVPENVALIEFVVRINSLTEYLNYYYQFYLHYNNNNNSNNNSNNNMNSSNNIVATGREEECHYLRIFLDALNKMMDAELHPHHSTSPAKTATISNNYNNIHTTPVKGTTNTHSNTPHKSTTAAICELDAIFEELDNSVDHEYDLLPAVSGGSDSSSNQTAQNTSANKHNNNNNNSNSSISGNRDRTPSDITSHESSHQLNSKLTRKTLNNKKNGANLYLKMIQLMKQCEDAISKIQYYQQNISQNALYNAKNAAKKNLDSLIYTGAKNNADNTPAKPPQNSDLTPEQEEKLAFETQLSNNLKEITALHHTLCNKMVNYNYFQFEELNAMLTSGINNNSGSNSSFSSNNNSMFNFFANKIYNFTANSSGNVASGQPKLTTEFVSSRDLFGTPAMSGGGSGGGSGRDTPTRQATAVLISQQSIATVLVRTKNIVLLTAIYETWPNLTVKIPMSSNGLSGSGGNNEMNTTTMDHNNISGVLHSPNKSKLHHLTNTPGGGNSLLQSNTFTSPVANRRQNALLQQQQTPTNSSTAGFKTPNRKLYTSGVFTGNQAPYVYAGSLNNMNNTNSSINNNSNSISKTGTSVVGNKINPADKISRQLSHTASFSFTNTNTLLNTALGGGMHINTTHSDSSGHLYNNPTIPRNHHAPSTPHTPHTPLNSSVHHVFAHGNHHSNSNTPSASPTKHNNVVTTTVTYTVDVDLSAVDFQDCKTLRDIGFTLVQLRESKGYELNTLLMAGFALQEFKHLKGMSITAKDLRLAGYSVSQCVQVGFDAASLRAGGYNDYELVNSHIFHPLALKAIGCDIQRYALMSLFEELDGKHWKNKTNWGSVHPLGEWYGVTVDEGTQSVVRIDLRSNYLKGKLPEALSLLTTLQYLDLYNNQLEGPIPDEYAKLVSLKDLWLTNNKDLIVNRAHLTTQLLPWCKIRLTQL